MPKLMTSISISKYLELHFLGRNGLGRMCGARVVPFTSLAVLHIQPITSKGSAGRCSIEIPVRQLDEFVEALQSAAAEISSSHAERWSSGAEQLMNEFGDWGDHPQFPRSDWLYEVANGDTQRGYWDFVVAKIDGQEADALQSRDEVPEE